MWNRTNDRRWNFRQFVLCVDNARKKHRIWNESKPAIHTHTRTHFLCRIICRRCCCCWLPFRPINYIRPTRIRRIFLGKLLCATNFFFLALISLCSLSVTLIPLCAHTLFRVIFTRCALAHFCGSQSKIYDPFTYRTSHKQNSMLLTKMPNDNGWNAGKKHSHTQILFELYCKQNAVRNVDYDIIPVKFCIWFGMAFSGIFVTRNLSAKWIRNTLRLFDICWHVCLCACVCLCASVIVQPGDTPPICRLINEWNAW